ncbi:hypothetical protein KIPB_012649, partial [Kipferlia bialata]|eukprot:g12649.t1
MNPALWLFAAGLALCVAALTPSEVLEVTSSLGVLSRDSSVVPTLGFKHLDASGASLSFTHTLIDLDAHPHVEAYLYDEASGLLGVRLASGHTHHSLIDTALRLPCNTTNTGPLVTLGDHILSDGEGVSVFAPEPVRVNDLILALSIDTKATEGGELAYSVDYNWEAGNASPDPLPSFPYLLSGVQASVTAAYTLDTGITGPIELSLSGQADMKAAVLINPDQKFTYSNTFDLFEQEIPIPGLGISFDVLVL